jgi:putative endonuclease
MYFVYVLQSLKSDRFYIGQTNNLIRRFHEHQIGKHKATRNRGPWCMPYYECFENRSQAVMRERKLKNMKSHRYIKNLIESAS